MIEVELKCRLSPVAQHKLRGGLQYMNFHGVIQNIDKYYDTIGFDLLQQGVFVRVRNNNQLQFKYNEGREVAHVQSVERAFPLVAESKQQAEEMNTLFTRFLPQWHAESSFEVARVTNKLVELAYIRNRREVYTNDGMQISIDHVESLGDFLEVEMQCVGGADTDKALAKLQTFIYKLGIQPVNIGYVEMWLHAHNPQAYQLGRYHA